MSKADANKSPASAADAFEAEIRANARPMLTHEERLIAAREKGVRELKWAAAKARAAAEAQLARAEELDSQAVDLDKRKGA